MWTDYQRAYETRVGAVQHGRCAVPANGKWYRKWAVATLLLEHLYALDPQWSKADFNVE
ncbi:MAG: hypothetical protein ACRDO2_08675 [Nocardioidaceae bacterium]